MKVLVTGATGFIGNYVVEELLRQNHHVVATSLNKQKAEKAVWYSKVTYVPLNLEDFTDSTDYYDYFHMPDIAIHLAWEGLPNYKDLFHEEINLPRHYAFLKNLIKNGLKDLTVTGTCFEYGMQEGCLQEDTPPKPGNPYGRAKNNLRERLEKYGETHSFCFKWVRLFYMYGKGQNPNSLISQLDKALEAGDKVFNMSGGEQIRDYLPVEKVTENIVNIALQNKVQGVINNCSGKPISVKNFVIDYLKKINKSIALNLGHYPYPDYEPMQFWGSVKKLSSL
jgi:nucleoside-diphosphate-sugar epimerase